MKKTTRVFAPGAFTWKNKGDAALVIAMLNWLESLFGDVDVTLTSFEPDEDARHYGVPVLPMPIRPRRPAIVGLHWLSAALPIPFGLLVPTFMVAYSRVCGWALVAWAEIYRRNRAIAARLAPSRITAIADAAVQADVVVSVPGGYLLAPRRADDWWLVHLPTFRLITALRCPLVLGPASYGPFHPSYEKTARSLFARCERIFVRETISRDYLLGAGIPADRIVLIPDLGFLFGAEGPVPLTAHGRSALDQVEAASARPLVGVSVRWHSFPGSRAPREMRARYVAAIAEAADRLVDRFAATAVLVPQVLDDIPVSREVLELMRHREHVILLDGDLSPADLQEIYRRLRMLIGTRMHANILAMSTGTPAVAIAYEPKTTGIMQMLELDEWLLDIENVDDRLPDLAEALWQRADEIRAGLPARIARVRERAIDEGRSHLIPLAADGDKRTSVPR